MSRKKVTIEPSVIKNYSVFYSGDTEKISPHSKGLLTYELGKEVETGILALRLTANGEGGLFSREWITFDAIHTILEQQQECFTSRVFRSLFAQGSTNNAGFLAAVLRGPDICLIEADSSRLFMHRCYADWQHRMTQLAKLNQD
ncbi:hypothetical protein [Pantoea eucalypti]|uniref:hypothetical protein n=1 Tax=Pantoea eucalypti TaxID=470933 RepID=UPI00099ABC59|nr:hypothetical protein [Pantoea eucalypti]SKA00327.1 hypothetical protein SAMN03097723_2748 [Pantoea eucalypti]